MKKLFIPLLFAGLLSACASTPQTSLLSRDVSPVQPYRLKGEEKPINIGGYLERIKKSESLSYSIFHKLIVRIDNEEALTGYLDGHYFGEITGKWHDKNVSASCTGKPVSADVVNVNCMIFVDNERTVTLTF